MTEMSAAPPPAVLLSYARRPRRRAWRLLLLLVALMLPAAAAWRWHAPVWRQTQILYWQHQCATYAPPADQVVFESDPQRAATLQASGDYAALPLGRGSLVVFRHMPESWARLCALTGWPPALNGWGSNLFMGERRNRAGQIRVVRVEFDPTSWVTLNSQVIRPGGLRSVPTVTTGGMSGMLHVTSAPGPRRLRLYAGQADPADPSRFTARYDLDGKTGLIEGRLTDDDGVVIRAVDGLLAGF